jgi:hypothetical protein
VQRLEWGTVHQSLPALRPMVETELAAPESDRAMTTYGYARGDNFEIA